MGCYTTKPSNISSSSLEICQLKALFRGLGSVFVWDDGPLEFGKMTLFPSRCLLFKVLNFPTTTLFQNKK